MSHKLKTLIHQRQKALASGQDNLFRSLRNRVNRERKLCRSRFFDSKVKQLKDSNPKQWWKSIKSLCGMEPFARSNDFQHILNSPLDGDTNDTALSNLANTINQAFLSPMSEFQPLVPQPVCTSEQLPSELVVTEQFTFKKLSNIKSSKAPGPDSIPGWLLRENANTLAPPVCKILNSSYQGNRLPRSWKMVDVSPLPKQKPVRIINKDLRPISLTPIISKVAEEAVVEQFIKPAILKVVYPTNLELRQSHQPLMPSLA